ncbi:MAG: NAD(P)-dependent oxidoreductase, partial [Candidatus Dormiibacterota bacterium]
SQLVNRCLEVPSLGCLVVAGVSANRDRWWLDDAAARLGYEPEDDAWDHAAEVGSTTVDEDYMGGYFVPAELGKRMD